MSHLFIPGTLWVFSNTASCIPSGCYRLEQVEDEFLVFSVGPEILFGLCKDYYTPLLSRVPRGRTMRTSPSSFIKRYAKLMQSRPRTDVPLAGMTFCMVAPRLQRKLHGLCPEGFLTPEASMH
jgi:hypothetical protein